MDDNERETFAMGNASGNEESQLDSCDGSNHSKSKDASNGRDDENNNTKQFILPIDKGYTSAAKALFWGRVHNVFSQMNIDTVYSSQARIPHILGKVFGLLASESFLRAIENGDVKAVTEFIKSSWTSYTRHLEDYCVNPIASNFPLSINDNHKFGERALNLSAKNRNAKAFCLITSAIFLKVFEEKDVIYVKRFLNGSRSERSVCLETLCIKPLGKNFLVNVDAFDMDCLLGSCISFFDWLECIYISGKANDYKIAFEMSDVLFKFEKIVDGVTTNGWTALHLAMFQFQSQFERRERMILLLLLNFQYFDENALTDDLETVLHFACRCSVSSEEFTGFMEYLLDDELNVNQRNSFGQTPLMIACKTGNAAAIRQLLDWKDDDDELDIDAIDNEGESALLLAKQSNNAEIVALIETKVFLRAAKNGDTKTVKFYLNALHDENDRGFIGEVSVTNAYAREPTAALFTVEDMKLPPSKLDESNNTEIVTMVEQSVFPIAVENGDTETLQIYSSTKESNFEVLHHRAETDIHFAPDTGQHKHNSEKLEKLSDDDVLNEGAPPKSLEAGLEAQFASKDFITHSIWLEAVTIANHKHQDEVYNLLFSRDRFIRGYNENGHTVLHQALKEYLGTKYDCKNLDKIEILLKSRKFSANDLNLQNETILEIVCKVQIPYDTYDVTKILVESYNSASSDDEEKPCNKISDLLEIFLRYGIDLNGRNKNGETFLMLACKNKRKDIVGSLLKLTSHGFVLDVDAVDNSGETALMKAKRNKDSHSAAALLRFKLKPAVEDENLDIVKSIFDEFCITSSDNSVKSSDDEEKSTRFEIWKEAMFIAMECNTKHTEDILKRLLDCDVVLSQDGYTGLHVLHCLMEMGDLEVDKRIPGIIEVLLESGKINVNAKSEQGHTVLHYARKGKLASMLIRYGADINKKDNNGKTPLMLAGMFMFTLGYKASFMRTILNEARTLDLDARDRDGRTALMLAATRYKPDVVELLLDAGASVNASDHIGFTALHHVLYGDIALYEEFPRKFEDLKKRKEIMRNLFDAEASHGQCHWYERSKEWNERRMKTAELLLRRPDIDVNALSFEKFSPLDIAEGKISETPPSIKNALKKKGAVLNVFQETESQSTSDFHPKVTCMLKLIRKIPSLIKNALKEKRTALIAFQQTESQPTSDFHLNVTCMLTLLELIDKPVIEDAEYFAFIKEKLLTFIKTFQKKIVSGKDQHGRTALHLVAISFSIMSEVKSKNSDLFRQREKDLARTFVEQLISLGCSVNAIDIYGRTPLHYADYQLQIVLKSKGADESIADKDGIIPNDKTAHQRSPATTYPNHYLIKSLCKRSQEAQFLRLKGNKNIEISVHYSDSHDRAIDVRGKSINPKEVPQLLWKEGKYAFRHPSVNRVTKKVNELMDAIAKEIKRLDSRFEIRPVLVGSSNEGTKFDEPDEFDFCVVLTKISELCEVYESPELPPGFVRLKRNLAKLEESNKPELDSMPIFRQDGILNTEQLNWQCGTILSSAVICVEKQQNFEWNLKLQKPQLNEELCLYNEEYINTFYAINKALNIKIIKPLIFTSVKPISIDIVPCIHIDDWWPDKAISNVSDDLKKFGCNLVFDSPQQLYPWVPYSESCARISFSKAESDTIRQSYDRAREAYMIGKIMISNSDLDSNYFLKNCLLYCIEAVTPTSEKASKLGLSLEELESKFHEMDRHLWLNVLMKCHLEFVSQDFCPCYFLPAFSSPFKAKPFKFLKGASLVSMADDSDHDYIDLCKVAYEFYRCTSNDTSDSCCQLPAPDPLWERFDRNQLIKSLREIAYK